MQPLSRGGGRHHPRPRNASQTQPTLVGDMNCATIFTESEVLCHTLYVCEPSGVIWQSRSLHMSALRQTVSWAQLGSSWAASNTVHTAFDVPRIFLDLGDTVPRHPSPVVAHGVISKLPPERVAIDLIVFCADMTYVHEDSAIDTVITLQGTGG
ncbi:hypothetical protein K470DRAFT_768 [Piedraia hortae CBS 480.64]|uniref:Uncharacterized protein n=1 Tax=Piedraia hortae CBS 480.64 TaxID=1314780 RepID=A0A6A7CA29_9PEZI|nr:hypothetical protein K470DRAFT_768 [Piedraia hortae CBS 480.64]